jgi:hypothetical protein
VPVICASDTTHLTNFSGDKKAWPIYLTIGNIKSTTRNKPSSMALILLALLPVPPKLKDSRSIDVSSENNCITHRVLSIILEGLVEPGQNGVTLDCADGQRRHCFPVLCAWIADHMEHVLLHNLKNNACPQCEVPSGRLGDPPEDKMHLRYIYLETIAGISSLQRSIKIRETKNLSKSSPKKE